MIHISSLISFNECEMIKNNVVCNTMDTLFMLSARWGVHRTVLRTRIRPQTQYKVIIGIPDVLIMITSLSFIVDIRLRHYFFLHSMGAHAPGVYEV